MYHGIGAPGLQRLHVVLDRDDRVGEAVDRFLRQRHAIAAQQLTERAIDAFHDLHDARFAEHQQARDHAAHQLRNLVRGLRFARLLERQRDRFLDARHVDDAFAQHRLGDLAELDVFRPRGPVRRRSAVRARHDHADELLVEAVLDLDQRRGHAQQRALARGRPRIHYALQVARLALHFVAQVAEAEHAERIGDLLQQLQLRSQLVDLRAALAHEDVERILHATQVFLDRRGDGLHQLDGRSRQAFARLFDAIVDRQQLGQPERRTHGGDARSGAARTRDVVEKVVEQLERRRIDVAAFALLIETLHLAIGMTEQALDRGAAFQPAFAQGFEHRADYPPQLEHRLRRRNLFELLRGARQDFEVLFDALALDPAEQAELKARPELARPLRDRQRFARRRDRIRLLVGAEIQQQQRSFREQRVAADGAQVVQQRQQDQRHVAPTAHHAFEIRRQLHHRAHQRVEALGEVASLGEVVDQITRDLAHFLGQQRGAVDFRDAQRAVHGAQVLVALSQQRNVVLLLAECLESSACVVELAIELARDDMQCLR